MEYNLDTAIMNTNNTYLTLACLEPTSDPEKIRESFGSI